MVHTAAAKIHNRYYGYGNSLEDARIKLAYALEYIAHRLWALVSADPVAYFCCYLEGIICQYDDRLPARLIAHLHRAQGYLNCINVRASIGNMIVAFLRHISRYRRENAFIKMV